MKKVNLILVCFMMFASLAIGQSADKTADTKATAAINWLSSQTIDVGKVEKGKPVAVTFEFSNAGDAPLFITSARGSCGCTSVDYTKEVVKPNKKGFVKTTYDAEATGSFSKTITVSVNTQDAPILLHIKGEVI
jgi:hypothetical protein